MRPPEVIVDFLFEDGLLFVEVANLGDEPALNVSVRFEPGLRGLGGTCEFSALPLFHHLAFLAPDRRIEAFLDTSAAYFARDEPERVRAIVSYKDPEGQPHKSVIRHDLSIYRSLPYVVGRQRSGGKRPHLP